MAYSWFKLHHDILGDIKLRRFSPHEKWAWIVLLTLASQGKKRGFVLADDEDISDACEFNSTQDWLYYRDKLIAKGMIEPVMGGIQIVHWEDRQYENPSDRPSETRKRKRKQRESERLNKKEDGSDVTTGHDDVTTMSRHRSDPDPDPDTDPDTDLSPLTPQGEERGEQKIQKSEPVATNTPLCSEPDSDRLKQTNRIGETEFSAAPVANSQSFGIEDRSWNCSNAPWKNPDGTFREELISAFAEINAGWQMCKLPNGKRNDVAICRYLRKLETNSAILYSDASRLDRASLLDYWQYAEKAIAKAEYQRSLVSAPDTTESVTRIKDLPEADKQRFLETIAADRRRFKHKLYAAQEG